VFLLLLACTPEPGDTAPTTPSATTTNTPTPTGAATSNLQWTEAIALDETFTVAQGETLTIDPGVTVSLGAEVDLIIEGQLIARGTADQPITFQPSGDSWGSVIFEATATGATFIALDDYDAGSIIEHAVFSGGTRALQLRGASPYITQSLFSSNTIPADVDQNGGAAILVSDGATPRVRDCTFEDNTAELFAFGGAIHVMDSDPILQDNTWTGNWSTYGGAISTAMMASPIVGNHLEGNVSASEGGAVSLLSTISAFMNNTVVANTAHADGGVHVCVTCYPHATPFFLDNTIEGNAGDVSHQADGTGGLGAAFLRRVTGNVITGNTIHGYDADFGWFHDIEAEGYPEWVYTRDISGNYWGTEDAETIAERIYDGTDNPALGTVTWDPVLSAPPEGPQPRLTIAPRKLRYVDSGDEMPVFLTIYNPGEERTVHLEIRRGDDAGADDPWTEDIAFPDAAAEADGWALVLPENSVYFNEILNETYTPGADRLTFWQATLTEDGAVIDQSITWSELTTP